MKFYSDITKKLYENEKELLKDEQKLTKEREEKELAEKKKSEERAVRAKEIEDAYNIAKDAYQKYNDLMRQFCKDYGSYHTTKTLDNARNLTLFDFINWF